MGRLVLTNQEKRVILFVVIAFLLGLVVKWYREEHPAVVPAREPPKLKTTSKRSSNGD